MPDKGKSKSNTEKKATGAQDKKGSKSVGSKDAKKPAGKSKKK